MNEHNYQLLYKKLDEIPELRQEDIPRILSGNHGVSVWIHRSLVDEDLYVATLRDYRNGYGKKLGPYFGTLSEVLCKVLLMYE